MTVEFRISATDGQLPDGVPTKMSDGIITIEIADLDHLLDFCEKYGPLVIESMCGMPSLEIYNDYRE
jgi:hypothetical protein